MTVKDKYLVAFKEKRLEDKLDRLLFEVELRLGDKADKRGKVSYQDIFQEITNARIAIKQMLE